MSNMNDFVIKNGMLTKYVGPGGDVIVPDNVVLPEGITSIGYRAFEECPNLTFVTLPGS